MEQLCFIGLGNNCKLAKDVLTNRGLKVMGRGMQFSDKFRFKWVQTSGEVNFMKFVEGRNIVNHFANAKIFTDKVLCIELLESLNRSLLSARIKSDIYKETKQFLPETYRLD